MNIFSLLRLYQDFLSGGIAMNDRAVIIMSCNGSTVQFPVPPAELPSIEQSQNNGVFNSVIGDMTTIGLMGSRTMTLELFLPSDVTKYSFAKGDNANDIINFINQNRPLGKPFNISITKGNVTYINMNCVLNNFSYRMVNTADYYCTLEIQEYVKREVMPSVTNTSDTSTTTT